MNETNSRARSFVSEAAPLHAEFAKRELGEAFFARLAADVAALDGVLWQALKVRWPEPLGPSSDLESAARVPDTNDVLIVESGDEGVFQRIFRTRVSGSRLEILGVIDWPTTVSNVEGTAVASVGGQLVFVYAERAQGATSTAIRWAALELEPFGIGQFQEVVYVSPDPPGPSARPVTSLEVDDAGRLYVASAYDPDDDNGPFGSVVWQVGQFETDDHGDPLLVLYDTPQRLATLDGLKVEAVAVRPFSTGVQVFAGVDDENYGGTLRPVWPR